MPKKKTGARKKKEKQKLVQRQIQQGSVLNARLREDLGRMPCNEDMLCHECGMRQKNRLFCYNCGAMQKLPMCGECGRTKCLGGDCLVPHVTTHAIGMSMIGAICDFCEAPICHSRKCIQSHACACVLRTDETVSAEPVSCLECGRSVWETGGRFVKCKTCAQFLCGDDQMEHQASCEYLDSESYKCLSCARQGMYSCLRCKICFCATHVVSKVHKALKGEEPKCKRCGYVLQETKALSMSTRSHSYGRGGAKAEDFGASAYYAWMSDPAPDAGYQAGETYDGGVSEEEGEDDDGDEDGGVSEEENDDEEEEEEEGDEAPAAGAGAGFES